MTAIQAKFKLNGDKIDKPHMYLGADFSNRNNVDDQPF